ncbi:LysM peptidoglycan-binding domain-containing protein [Aquihabitans sp. G128]|uniref:LysM peptidoglycan-binding domain-containing protein n=1 Tax=Aquihabitans sp. G128 TaxID=2849779 RepID=UPI001C245FBB|nr:LysM domain-containing protein [Aquihabitans sp. G128]QXC62404.1 LysM peptidoglycan-binding domain-containing protein [Aquihabitans sp. G128]
MSHPRGERAWVRAVGTVAPVVVAVALLHHLGRGALALPPVRSAEALAAWASGTDPLTVALVVLRLAVLGAAYHFLATTVLALLGHGLRRPSLVRLAERSTPRLLRQARNRSLGLALTLGAALVGPIPPASAAPHPVGGAAEPAVPADQGRATLRRLEPASPTRPGEATLRRTDAGSPRRAADPERRGDGTAVLRRLTLTPKVSAERNETSGRATLRRIGPADEDEGPQAAPSTSAAGSSAARSTASAHRVQPGDHLWAIAEATLAASLGRPPTDAEIDPFWRQVVAANPQLADPDLLHPGDTISVPALSVPARAPAAAPHPTPRTSTVTLRPAP